MQFVLLILVLLVVGAPLRAQNAAYDLPIREHLLPNGLRLLVLERPGDHRVAAKIFTEFGALNEEPGELGTAHFLEHLMFKGTPSLGTRDWEAERVLHERIDAVERALTEELNRDHQRLRQRGVFHEYRHAESTPRLDSLRAEVARLDAEVQRYREHGAMMKWYQAFGGARLTATTEQEYMKFDINLPVERLPLFFRIEADRMVNSVFREFDQERMILVEQRYGDLNRPTTPYYEAMNALVGSVHPVFWPEGYLTDFEQYTRHYHRDLYERYFIPNNSSIVLIGGVSLEQAIPLAERYFGWMERRPEPTRPRAVEPTPQAEKRLIWRSAALAPRVEARFLIPGVGHPDRPHFDVLAAVAEAQLRQALREAGLSANVNVNSQVVHTSRFGVPATLNFEVVVSREEELPRAEETLLALLDRLAREPAAPGGLELAQKQLRADWHRLARDADRLGFEIGHFQVMDSWRTLQPYLEARDRTSPQDVRRLAARYFVAENRSIGIVRPPETAAAAREGL
ncbi:MAG: insulinase family protein [Gemmatimonadota bacterium]|nr:insulinase family protein [Gemmatimonadota bacterium]